MTEDFLSSLIEKYSAAITCFCFMGGDAEPSEVERLAKWIKSQYPHLKTAWYSGAEKVADGFDLAVLDFIKIGPYRQELGGLKSPKTNQALYKIEPDRILAKLSL